MSAAIEMAAESRPRRRWRPAPLLAMAVFVVVALLHWPVLRHEFVWDDVQISVDGYVHDLRNLSDVLTLQVLGADVLDNNRPGMLASLMFDAALWGRRPAGYHLTNVFFHAANAALLVLLAARIAGVGPQRVPGSGWSRSALVSAAVAILFFALHPAVVEPVAVVAFREDPQTTFFLLVSVWFALALSGASSRRAWWFAAGSLLAVAGAVSTKESGAVAPLILAACATIAATPATRRVWSCLVLCSMATVVAFLVARFAAAPSHSDVYLSAPARLFTDVSDWIGLQARIMVFHAERLLNPALLAADYTSRSYAHIPTAGAVAGIALVLLGLAVLAWRRPATRIGIALTLGGLAAVGNLVPLFNPVADRYLYLPLAGAALAVAVLAVQCTSGAWRTSIGLALAPLLLLVAVEHRRRLTVFQDDVSLWTDTLNKTPESIVAGNLRGWAEYRRGDYAAALRSFELALANAGGREPDSWAGGALACHRLGDAAAAEHAYRSAVELLPLFREPDRIRRAYFWPDEHLATLAEIARPTGLWIEAETSAVTARVVAKHP